MRKSDSTRPVKPRRLSRENKLKLELVLSDRHRLWGFYVPMVNVDFLVIRYDSETPLAVIEYKHIEAEFQEDSNIRALLKLCFEEAPGRYRPLPLYVVRWEQTWDWFQILDGRDLQRPLHRFGEREYVQWQYSLAHREMPADLPFMDQKRP